MRLRRTLLGYAPVDSPVRALHPATRILSVLLVTCVPLLTLEPRVHGALVVAVLALFLPSRVPLRVLWRYTPIFALLLAFLLLVYTAFPGDRLRGEAIRFALEVYLRIASLLVVTIYALHILDESEIVAALRSLRVPFVVCYTLGLAFRSIGMFLDDTRIVREAELARAYDPRSISWVRRPLRLFRYVVVLLALAVRRTDEFSDAITARAFSFGRARRRPNYLARRYPFRGRDAATLLAVAAACAGMVAA